GVSLEIPPGSSMSEMQAKLGSKIKAVRCPTPAAGAQTGTAREPVCAERLFMMPSSRVEIAVAPWTGRSTRAVLRNHAYDTGPAGDRWPPVELATIRFPERSSGGEVKALPLKGQSRSLLAPGGLLTRSAPPAKTSTSSMRCQQLASGRARQIVF